MSDDRTRTPVFGPTRGWHIAILAAILVCGFAIRLFDLTDPPLDYAPSRQLRSAIIARGIYTQFARGLPDWQAEVAARQRFSQEMLEPEVLEHLTAWIYLLSGGVYPWVARILSSLFWTLGGLALYFLARSITSGDGAVISLIFYLFDPFSLLASRTFQPDPLMTAMIVLAWLSFMQWRKHRNWSWSLAAGLSMGAAIFLKSTAVFFLFFGAAVVLLSESKLRVLFADLQIWLVGILSILPAILYHIYGYFISGGMRGQLAGRLFNASLWGTPSFYLGWASTTGKVLGHWFVLGLALLGLFYVKDNIQRRFLFGTWVGFLVYGFAVSYYVTTHSYYLLPVIPLASLTLGALLEPVLIFLSGKKLTPLIWMGTATILIMGLLGAVYLYSREDYRHEPGYYQKVAGYVSPDESVIALSQDYGYRLAYYGWITVQPWDGLEKLAGGDQGDSFASGFQAAMENFDYFIITRMKDYRAQPQLSGELESHYPLLKEGGGYLIYDLRERLD